MTKFKDLAEVCAVITSDLERELKIRPEVKLWDLEDCPFIPSKNEGILIDREIPQHLVYNCDETLLIPSEEDVTVRETLRSNILRTLCPVTSQPDHAEVTISYSGKKTGTPICAESILYGITDGQQSKTAAGTR